MKKIPKSMWILLFLVIASYALREATQGMNDWRYCMTVTVSTPEGVKTGSAVREIHTAREIRIFPDQGGGYNFAGGEAVVVDLGHRGRLFALMKGGNGVSDEDYGASIATRAFPDGKETPIGTSKTVYEFNYPMFVHFRNMANPLSIERVIECCEKKVDRTEEIFGKGVVIQDVTIERVDAPVTEGIESVLPWLAELGRHNLEGGDVCQITPLALYTCVFARDFKTGRL